MAVEIGPALGLTADSKSLVAATEDLRDISKAASVAEKAADGFSGSGKRMSAAMAASLSVLKSMDASLIKLAASQQKSNNEQDEAARKARALQSQYEQLRASLDPVYSNSKRYESALETLNASQAAGVISAQDYQRSLSLLDAQYTALSNKSISLGQNTAVVGNVFAQFNDIGMMAFAGQSPLMLAIQQGTQLNQVWVTLGGSTAAIGATMKAAFMQLLNPLNLATLGIIAGGAALLQWGMSALSAGGSTKSFSDRVGEAEDAIQRIRDASAALAKGGLEDLRAKYGTINAEIRSLVEQERILALAEGTKKINAALAGITETLGAGIMATAYGDIEAIFASTANEAQVLWGVLDNISKEKGLDNQLFTIKLMKDRLSEATNGFAQMTDKQLGMLNGLVQAESLIRQQKNALFETPQAIDAAARATEWWSGAMSSVSSYVGAIAATMNSLAGGAIQLAAIKTETELLRQGKSLRDASFAAARKTNELEGEKRTRELKAQYGIIGEGMAWMENRQKTSLLTAQQQLDVERDLAREREREAGKSSTKGATELKAAQKGFQSVRELMEEEAIFEFAEYEKRQAQLDAALQKRLLSESMYQQMRADLRTMYFGSEWEQQALRYEMDQEALQTALDNDLITREEYYRKRKEMQWANLLSEQNRSDMAQDLSNTAQYFGQLHTLSGSKFDGLLKLQKAFSAASALMNAWEGYTTVLRDPTVPFWGKLAAAGTVLAAGMGAVQAIKGASMGGAVASSAAASSGGSKPSAPVTQAEAPLRVSLDAFDSSQLYTGASVQKLFEMVQKEAGNRGIIWVPTN